MVTRIHELGESLRRRAVVFLDPRRRFNLQDQERSSWEERAETAADLLRSFLPVDGAQARLLRIGDFGCGNQRLHAILNGRLGRPIDYSGFDLYPQSPDVERFDAERGLPRREFDVVFCLGLLEYLNDFELFARRLRQVCPLAIVSYVVADAEGSLPPAERRKRGWRTDYTRAELERVFEESRFEREAFTTVDDGATGLWLWAERKPAGS
jgi:hypothetical protein